MVGVLPLSSGRSYTRGMAGLMVMLVLVFGALAVALIVVGRRGRVVDDHPVCRRCGFDLVGAPTQAGRVRTCPECGVTAWPRHGNRERRPGVLAAGVVLLAAVLLVGGLVAYETFDAAALARYKPVALLRWEAAGGTSPSAGTALDELLRRLNHGQLSAAQQDELIADAVAHGPAGNAPLARHAIGSKWDDLAGLLIVAGHGTPAQHEALARTWHEKELEVRPQIEVGAKLPISVHGRTYGSPQNMHIGIDVNQARIVVDDGAPTTFRWGGSSASSSRRGSGWAGGSSGRDLMPGRELPDDLPLGDHTLRLELDVTLTDRNSGRVLATYTESLTDTFAVVPKGGDAIALIKDPAAAAAIDQNLTIDSLEVKSWGASVTIKFKDLTRPVAYQLYLVKDGERWPFVTFATTSSSGSHGTSGRLPEELKGGGVVDVMFEPSKEKARDTVGITEILDHPFVIHDVEITTGP